MASKSPRAETENLLLEEIQETIYGLTNLLATTNGAVPENIQTALRLIRTTYAALRGATDPDRRVTLCDELRADTRNLLELIRSPKSLYDDTVARTQASAPREATLADGTNADAGLFLIPRHLHKGG